MTTIPPRLHSLAALCALGLAVTASLSHAAQPAAAPTTAPTAPAVAAPTAAPAAPAAKADATAPVFAEDFESGTINKAVWDTRATGGSTVTVQTAQVHSGKNAVQIHYPKGVSNIYASLVATKLPDAVRTHLFGRAYVFASPKMSTAAGGHDALISAGTPGWPLSNFLEIGASGGKNVMASYQENAPGPSRGETISKANPPYPVGKWFCLEWEFNDSPDSITVWIDGVASGELKNFSYKPRSPAGAASVPGKELVKGFSDFAFGFRYWGSAKDDLDLYYDDIVIDTKRVGPMK